MAKAGRMRANRAAGHSPASSEATTASSDASTSARPGTFTETNDHPNETRLITSASS